MSVVCVVCVVCVGILKKGKFQLCGPRVQYEVVESTASRFCSTGEGVSGGVRNGLAAPQGGGLLEALLLPDGFAEERPNGIRHPRSIKEA